MKTKSIFLLVAILASMPGLLAAQGTLTIESSKSTYLSGEPIEFSITVKNETSSLFQLGGSSSCQASFKFDGLDWLENTACTLDILIIDFNPGSWRTWTWTLDPNELGLPLTDGSHEIIGYYPGTQMADTIHVEAPRSLGGKVYVSINEGVSHNDLQSVVDSLRAEVLHSFEHSDGHRNEEWMVAGTNPDDAVTWLNTDQRFRGAEVVRFIQGPMVTAIEDGSQLPKKNELVAIYPNPCSTTCRLRTGEALIGPVDIALYDVLGRRVSGYSRTLTGQQPVFDLDVSDLPNGVYFMVASERDRMTSTSFLVLR
jgi:hypothetical protein